MKVLGLVGLAERIEQETWPLEALIELTDNGKVLASSLLPASWSTVHGRKATGIRRTAINLMLKNNVLEQGIEIRCGWQLTGIAEEDDYVRAAFSNGEVVEGDILVGCDGIKSTTRTILLKQKGSVEGAPAFTGLSQVGR